MFKIALQRMGSSPHGQAMPVVMNAKGVQGDQQGIQGYELQWTEAMGVDPSDMILCRYRVRDPDDVKRINDALARRQSVASLANS